MAYLQGIVMVEFSMQSCKDIHKHHLLVMLGVLSAIFYIYHLVVLVHRCGNIATKYWLEFAQVLGG